MNVIDKAAENVITEGEEAFYKLPSGDCEEFLKVVKIYLDLIKDSEYIRKDVASVITNVLAVYRRNIQLVSDKTINNLEEVDALLSQFHMLEL